ncbi:MAG: hypothetical protein ACJAUD_002331 [Crocinitomicaceae bacterium]|jgi:hypothetical protein
MKKLKSKICETLSRLISIEEFETWLYSTPEILNAVETNDLIFQVVSLDYKGKHIFHELEMFCFQNFDNNEFMVELIQNSCEAILKSQSNSEMKNIVDFLAAKFDWDDDNSMLNEFYWLQDEIETKQWGYGDEKAKVSSVNIGFVKKYAQKALIKLEGASQEEKIKIFRKGCIDRQEEQQEEIVIEDQIKNKLRFQFWK